MAIIDPLFSILDAVKCSNCLWDFFQQPRKENFLVTC